MSFIKDFSELNLSAKTSIITVIGQLPFFFVAVYLFDKNLISRVGVSPLTDMDLWFIFSLCFCLSATWFVMNVLSATLIISMMEKYSKATEEVENDFFFVAGTIYSIGYLSLIIVVNYFGNWSFAFFIGGSFSFIVVRTLYTFIALKIANRR